MLTRTDLKRLSPDQYRQLRTARWKARTDLGWLCREILGYPDVSDANGGPFADLHQPLIDLLQKFPCPVGDQEFDNDRLDSGEWVYKPIMPMLQLPGKRRTLILDSRGCLKTTINSIAHTIQWIINYPEISILIFMGSDTKATDILGEIKRHFQYNEAFRTLFSEHCPIKSVGDWGRADRFTSEARPKANVRKEPTIMTGSIEKGAAGYHFDVIKFSDIVDENNIQGNGLTNVLTKFDISVNLLVAPRYWMDVEGTRYHFADTYGKIIERQLTKLEKDREYNMFIRGIFKRKVDGPEKFTMDEGKAPFLKDEEGKRISRWPDRFDVEFLDTEEKNDPWIFACSRGDQPILMADWSEKPISTIQVGDEIMGWKKYKGRNCLLPTKVLATNSHKQMVQEIKLSSGHITYQTIDHKWWSMKKSYGGSNYPYKIVKENDPLYHAISPIRTLSYFEQNEATWLGGILDGEGTLGGDSIIITQSIDHNPEVCNRIEKVLSLLEIPFTQRNNRSGHTGKPINCYQISGRSNKRKLLLYCKPTKSYKIIQSLYKRNRNLVEDGGEDFIISMKDSGVAVVYGLTTETGNYVVSSILSANCQRLNYPVSSLDGATPFPVNDKFPVKISREDYNNNVRIAYKEICVDLASTDNKRSNYTVITVGAVSASGRIFVEEIIHGKFLADQAVDKIFAAAEKHYRHLRAIKIEQSEYLRGLWPSIQRRIDTKYAPKGIYFNIETIQRGNRTAKADRIYKHLQPFYKSSDLRFLDDIDPAAWKHLIKEMEEFPSSATDDILDSIADFLADKEYFGREIARGNPNVLERNRLTGQFTNPNQVNAVYRQVQREKFDQWLQIQSPEDEKIYLESGLGAPVTRNDPWFAGFGIY